MTPRPRVGWISLGHIGRPMAERVLAAGLPLAVWAYRREAAAPLLALGAAWARDSAALMPAARPGTVFTDMTAAAPAPRRRLQRWPRAAAWR